MASGCTSTTRRAAIGSPLRDAWSSGPIGRDRASDQTVRQLVDEDLTVCGELLETLGDVDGFSGHKRLAGGGAGGDGLPGADSETGGKANPEGALQLIAELPQGLAHLARGADGPEGIVLMEKRNPEDSHQRVARVGLRGAAVPFEHRMHVLEAPRYDTPVNLRVESFVPAARGADTREQHSDGLAHHLRGRCNCLRADRAHLEDVLRPRQSRAARGDRGRPAPRPPADGRERSPPSPATRTSRRPVPGPSAWRRG